MKTRTRATMGRLRARSRGRRRQTRGQRSGWAPPYSARMTEGARTTAVMAPAAQCSEGRRGACEREEELDLGGGEWERWMGRCRGDALIPSGRHRRGGFNGDTPLFGRGRWSSARGEKTTRKGEWAGSGGPRPKGTGTSAFLFYFFSCFSFKFFCLLLFRKSKKNFIKYKACT